MTARRAYYNEFDPIAAQWLRNLIAAGHIAPGDVDERSIVDVRPGDLAGYVQCHFFAGIGVWSYALRRAGWRDEEPVWTGSCPCQPFSEAGAGKGFDDERHLWPEWERLIRERRPVAVFGEQVASKIGLAWLDIVHADLEAAGYTVGAVDLCAAGVGAPHIRQRIFFVADTGSERIRDHGRAADARAPEGSEGEGIQRQRVRDDARHEGDGRARPMADADEDGRDRLQAARVHGRWHPEGCSESAPRSADGASGNDFAGCGAAGDMAHPGGEGCATRSRERESRSHEHGADAERCSRLGDADGERREGCTARPRAHGRHGLVAPSAVNGFWSDAVWIPCRDGKARPIEPGTFPLAHGAPARVGRLRAYGNAINAEAAREFISAYRDVRAS